MEYNFKGALFKPDFSIADKGVTVGKDFFPIEDIKSAQITHDTGKGSGIATLFVAGCPVKLYYSKKDREEIKEAIKDLKEIISSRTYLPVIDTSADVADFCYLYGFNKGLSDKWIENHFNVHMKMLKDDEIVLLPFVGYHNFKTTRNTNPGAYTLTNKRLLRSRQKITTSDVVAIDIDDIREVFYVDGNTVVSMKVNSLTERFTVGLDRDVCLDVIEKFEGILNAYKLGYLDELIEEARIEKAKLDFDGTDIIEVIESEKAKIEDKLNLASKRKEDPVNRIREYKKLLDEGIITEEEFEKKKKNLLEL